ncbi:MAG: DUF4249 family protein [Bacteroidota bacterium]
MFKRIFLTATLCSTLLTACYDSNLVFEDQFRAVVEAYIYVDREVDHILLTSMIGFGNDSSGGEKVSNALLVLEQGEDSRTLAYNDSLGCYYLEESPRYSPGDTLKLTVRLDNETLLAKTVIPGNPPPVSISSGSIYVPKVENMMDFRDVEMPDPVELSWDNPEARYYFLNIQNIESNPVSIMPDPPDDRPFAQGGFPFQMITKPTNDNHYSIDTRQLTHFGTHRIIMTSVNDEYVNLYNSLNQDSRELNEPYSNINNGLGIFTAFNSDTIFLEVVPVYQ